MVPHLMDLLPTLSLMVSGKQEILGHSLLPVPGCRGRSNRGIKGTEERQPGSWMETALLGSWMGPLSGEVEGDAIGLFGTDPETLDRCSVLSSFSFLCFLHISVCLILLLDTTWELATFV
jgi:hypothetical protein